MKEVKTGRVSGPYEKIPYKNFIQSPVGLVPKAGGKTHMIFHLSYEFGEDQPSVNASTPRHLCTVKYNDLDVAVHQCLQLYKKACEFLDLEKDEQPVIFMGNTDLSSAFHVLPLKVKCFCWLIFKAEDPKDGKVKYFVKKCLPFGASISCAHYQRFSNALKHLLLFKTGTQKQSGYQLP